MNLVKIVRDYISQTLWGVQLDPIVTNSCVDNITEDEKELLTMSPTRVRDDHEMMERYKYLMKKLHNRHNDISAHFTSVNDDGTLEFSDRSCITELDILPSTYQECTTFSITRIRDATKEALMLLSLESIADLTQALILWGQ